MEKKELPDGWEWKKLEDIVLFTRNGVNLKQDKTGIGTPITRIETISDGIIDPSRVGYIQDIEEGVLQTYKLIEGDLLFSHINSLEHIGKTAIYKNNPKDLVHGVNLLLLRPEKEIVEPQFLQYLFREYRSEKIFWSMANKAVNQASINQTRLNKLLIPLPPLPVQRRIVEILDQADALRHLRAQADAKTQTLLQSVFYEMFGDPVRNEKEWEIKTIQELTNNSKNAIKRGPFGSSIKKDFFVSSGYKVYEQKNVIYQNFTLGHYYIDEEKFKELKDFEISPDDLLISCSGTIGKIAIVPSAIEKGVINQALLKLTLDQQKIYPIYFKFMFELVIEAIINQNVRGSAMVNIVSVEELKKIKFPIPPLPLQQQFTFYIKEFEQIRNLQTRSNQEIERLFEGLMTEVFMGELFA